MDPDTVIRSKIKTLVRAWEKQIPDDPDSPAVPLAIRVSQRSVPAARFHLIWGYTAHCYSLADAVLGLTEGGYILESIPLVRLIYETGLTAYWVTAVEDGVLGMMDRALRLRQKAARDFMKVDVPEVREAGELLMARSDFPAFASPSMDQASRFERICRDFAEGDLLYANYRALSTFTHPSFDVVGEYVRQGTLELRLRPRMDDPDDPRPSWLGLALQGLVLATASLTPYLEDQDVPLVRAVEDLVNTSSVGLIPTLTEKARVRVSAGAT